MMADAPAAIMASLVDVRNVSAHKCVRLEIHVPVEQAGAVMAAFGWPTAVDPVPVAIARLDVAKAQEPPAKERRAFCDLALSQQAALKSNDPVFQKFMGAAGDSEKCASNIRQNCLVQSRKDIIKGTIAGDRWIALLREFDGVR